MAKEFYADSDCASVKVGIEPAFAMLIPVREDGTTEIIVCEKDEVKTDIRNYFTEIFGETINIYSYDVFGKGKILATISGKYHVYVNKQTVVLEKYG